MQPVDREQVNHLLNIKCSTYNLYTIQEGGGGCCDRAREEEKEGCRSNMS